jgi:hypothetical protein
MNPSSGRRNFEVLTLRKTWLWIAGTALIPLAAGASTSLQTTIVQNGAPISIDECVAVLQSSGGNKTNSYLSERVDFTNVSQLRATEVRFAFEIVDAGGRTESTLTGDTSGSFAPGVAITHSTAPAAGADDMRQTISGVPSAAKVACSVRMVRFDDGSVWHEGDGPAGSAVMYTPLPGPSTTPQWQWPEDRPTP